MLTNTQIRAKLELGGFDKVIRHADGTWTVKRSFFYTHGHTAQHLADRVLQLLPSAKILIMNQDWKRWPTTSYWVVTFRPESVVEQGV